MRASRLLAIVLLLQSRGAMTATTLSEELEVSVRTIYRDIEACCAAGVPIYAERGREGGYALVDGWQSHLTGLSLGEAQAMFLVSLQGPAEALGLSELASSGQRKVSAALASLGRVDHIATRFHLDPLPWYRQEDHVEHLGTVAEAVWQNRQITMTYDSWRSSSERTVAPLGLVLKAGSWYLVAKHQRDIRMYRAAEIRAITLGEQFKRPSSFNLATWWATHAARFEQSLTTELASVRVSPEYVSTAQRSMQLKVLATARPDRRGWLLATVPIESISQAVQLFLPCGNNIEVLEPSTVRTALRSTIRQMTKLYGS